MTTSRPCAALCLSLVISGLLGTEGLNINLDRDVFLSAAAVSCGKIRCSASGNDATIESISLSRLRVADRRQTRLLTVHKDDATAERTSTGDNIKAGHTLNDHGVQGIGEVTSNTARIHVTLLKVSDCLRDDLYSCQVTYLNPSGQRETTFTMTGPTQNPSELDLGTSPKSSVAEKMSNFSSELGLLAERVTENEEKLDILKEELEGQLATQDQNSRERLETAESRMLSRVDIIDTTLTEIDQRLTLLDDRLDTFNQSIATSVLGDQATDCIRGMGDDVTKSYPRYAIIRNKDIGRDILCDTHTNGGGWIVIQRRANGEVDFYKDWSSYRIGFGLPSGNFWLGNEAIYQLTNSAAYELRVDIRFEGKEMFAFYDHFRIENEADKYRLRLPGRYSGTAEDALAHSVNWPFSTFDAEHDVSTTLNCAVHFHGGWWYQSCADANLNGMWNTQAPTGVFWKWAKNKKPVSFSEIKIRRVKAPQEP